MRRLLLCLAVLACFAGLAGATNITYSTSGELCIGVTGCGLTSVTVGDTTLTYVPLGSTTVDANPITGANFGTLNVSCVGGGTACATTPLPANLVLNITVSQTVPFAGSGSIDLATVTGSIGGTTTNALVTWLVNSVTLTSGFDSSIYTITNNPLNLVPASSNNGDTTIQGNVRFATSETPEPSTYGLIASGLLGLGFMARRRK